MLTRLRLANLKTWGERIWQEGMALAPITLVLGANSSGKTSLLQMPLLVKQTFRGADRLAHLNLGGHRNDLVHLGDYQSVIHNHEVKRQLKLGLSFRDGMTADDPLIDYAVTFIAERGRPFVRRLELSRDGQSYATTRQPNGTYTIDGPGYEPASRDRAGRRAFEPLRALSFSGPAVAALGPAGVDVQKISRKLQQAVDNIAYLGPLREYPERSYMWTGPAPRDLGRKGERTALALIAEENAQDPPPNESEPVRLIDRVSTWLKRLGLADELVLRRETSTRSYELVVVRGKQRANIVDVGFGVSQVLPVIVLAYLMPPGATIIMEQPELHLHPGAQAGLADLLAEVSRERQVQFLVETHSELLFRHMQTLIAEERLTPAQCALYWVGVEGGEAALTWLDIDEFGRVANWPKQFFGDAVGEAEKQMRLMLERRRLRESRVDG
jgi:hypothetical protein